MSDRVKPGPVVIPNCIEVKILWGQGARKAANVLHGQFTGSTIPTTLPETLFTAFKSALTSSGWGSQIHSDMSMTGVAVKDLRQPNLAEMFSTGAAQAGTGAGQAEPAQVAVVVTQQTAQSGRAFRGRTYLGGLDSAAVASATTHTATAGTDAAAFLTAIQSAMSANSCPLAIGQKELLAGTDHKGNPLAPRPANVVPVTQCRVVSQRLDSQRRRLGR